MLLSTAIDGFILQITTTHALTTKKLYQLSLRTLINYLQDRPIADITTADLRRYMAYLRSDYVPHRVSTSTRINTPLSSAAIDNHWKCLRSFFRWATDELKIPNPAENLARPHYQDPQIIPYSAEEVAALIQAAEFYRLTRGEKVIAKQRPTGKRNRAIVLTLLDTGIRIGECCRLKVANVLLEASEIQIQPFSTGRKTKPRTIPLGKATRLALWRYMTSERDLDPAHLLFGLGTASMHRLILSIGKWAHVPNTHAHRFRHTFAIEYLRNGGDVFTLQRILGHASLDMVNRYLRLVQTDLSSAHRRASPVDNWRL